MKKILSAVLSVIMTLVLCSTGLIGLTAYAADSYFGSDKYTYHYTIKDGGARITSVGFDYIGSAPHSDIVIPSKIGGYPVTAVEKDAFSKLPEDINAEYHIFNSVTIPDSVTYIGKSAFSGINGITSVKMSESIQSIDSRAFANCCRLSSIRFPDTLVSIGDSAFSGCDELVSIAIPDSVTSIGSHAFEGTGYYTNKSNWSNGVLYIGNYLIKANESLNGDYTIKDGTKTIADLAFEGCAGLKSVTFPDSVVAIGMKSFGGCAGLTSVRLGGSLKYIKPSAFVYCSDLDSITVNPKNTTFHSKYNCLIDTKNKTLVFGGNKALIPDDGSVTAIGANAFSCRKGLKSIIIPESVTLIDTEAFWACEGLTSITIPKSVTKIREYAFYFFSGLKDVWYEGSAEDKEKIDIEYDNGTLLKADWHFDTPKQNFVIDYNGFDDTAVETAVSQKPISVTSSAETTVSQKPVPVTSNAEMSVSQKQVSTSSGVETTVSEKPMSDPSITGSTAFETETSAPETSSGIASNDAAETDSEQTVTDIAAKDTGGSSNTNWVIPVIVAAALVCAAAVVIIVLKKR